MCVYRFHLTLRPTLVPYYHPTNSPPHCHAESTAPLPQAPPPKWQLPVIPPTYTTREPTPAPHHPSVPPPIHHHPTTPSINPPSHSRTTVSPPHHQNRSDTTGRDATPGMWTLTYHDTSVACASTSTSSTLFSILPPLGLRQRSCRAPTELRPPPSAVRRPQRVSRLVTPWWSFSRIGLPVPSFPRLLVRALHTFFMFRSFPGTKCRYRREKPVYRSDPHESQRIMNAYDSCGFTPQTPKRWANQEPRTVVSVS